MALVFLSTSIGIAPVVENPAHLLYELCSFHHGPCPTLIAFVSDISTRLAILAENLKIVIHVFSLEHWSETWYYFLIISHGDKCLTIAECTFQYSATSYSLGDMTFQTYSLLDIQCLYYCLHYSSDHYYLCPGLLL